MEVLAFAFVLSGVYGRFAYESFRQLPVRQLLKSFHFPTAFTLSVAERTRYIQAYRTFLYMLFLYHVQIYMHSSRFASWRNDVSDWRTGR